MSSHISNHDNRGRRRGSSRRIPRGNIVVPKIETTKVPEIETTEAPEPQGDCDCGKSPNQNSNEIAGGKEARPNEFPWMVRIIGGCAQGDNKL